MRFSNSDVREMHKLALALGYRYVGKAGGHLKYEHDECSPFELAWSPSDSRFRENTLAKFRARHPSAPELERAKADPAVRASRKKQRARRRKQVEAHKRRSIAAPSDPAPAVRRRVLAAWKHRCEDCGHPWTTTAYLPDVKCPRPTCGSSDVWVWTSERAA